MKEYVKLSVNKKIPGSDFTGKWIYFEDLNEWAGKLAVHLESNYFDLEESKIEWGYTIKGIRIENPNNIGESIFRPFNVERIDYEEPHNGFKIKGMFSEFGSALITVTINDITTLSIDVSTQRINNGGFDNYEEVYYIEDVEPEPVDPPDPEPDPIPVPDVEPAVDGFWDALKQVFKDFFKNIKWYLLAYLIGLFTPTIIKVINFILKIF